MKNVFLAHPIFYATFPFPFDFNPISGNFLAKSRHFPFQLSRANAKVKGKINCFLTSASWLADLRTFCKLKCLSNRKTFFLGMFLCDYLTAGSYYMLALIGFKFKGKISGCFFSKSLLPGNAKSGYL